MENQTQRKKKPSYLAQIKDELLKIIIANHASDRQDAQEITDELWLHIRKWITNSYYNGVRDGASGKVKPKSKPRESNS